MLAINEPVADQASPDPTTTSTHWVRSDAKDETWHLNRYQSDYGYVSRYSLDMTEGYNWQAIRGNHRISGSAKTIEDAMAEAERGLAMPIEQFNSTIADALMAEISKKEKELLAIAPHRLLLPGYSAGYEAGMAEAMGNVIGALSNLPGAQGGLEARPIKPAEPNHTAIDPLLD